MSLNVVWCFKVKLKCITYDWNVDLLTVEMIIVILKMQIYKNKYIYQKYWISLIKLGKVIGTFT